MPDQVAWRSCTICSSAAAESVRAKRTIRAWRALRAAIAEDRRGHAAADGARRYSGCQGYLGTCYNVMHSTCKASNRVQLYIHRTATHYLLAVQLPYSTHGSPLFCR